MEFIIYFTQWRPNLNEKNFFFLKRLRTLRKNVFQIVQNKQKIFKKNLLNKKN